MQRVKDNTLQWVILAICSLTITDASVATSVVMVRRPDRIVVASDTLSLVWKDTKWERKSRCKIRTGGGIFFAFSGFDKDPTSGFYPDKIGRTVLSRTGTIASRANDLVETIRKPLLHAAERVHREIPSQLAEQIIGNHGYGSTILQLVVFGMERGVPTVVAVNFNTISGKSGRPVDIKPDVSICPGAACRDGDQYWLMGERAALDKAIKESFMPFWTGRDAEDVRKAVNVEVRDKPEHVGSPIDVLVIDASGPYWIPPPGKCGP